MTGLNKRDWLAPTVFALIVIVLWEIIPWLFGTPHYLFPRFSATIDALWSARGNLGKHLWITALESLIGCAMGASVGFLLGVLMAQFRLVAKTILPYVVGSNAIPVVAIAPIVVLWFGHGLWSKCVVAAFLGFFPIAINTYRGLSEFTPIYNDLFRTMGATETQFFFRFKLPNSLPFVFSGLKLTATYSVIGAVVAEFVGSDVGLGFAMLRASYNLNTPQLWGYLIVACLLGISMYGASVLAERVVLRNRGIGE